MRTGLLPSTTFSVSLHVQAAAIRAANRAAELPSRSAPRARKSDSDTPAQHAHAGGKAGRSEQVGELFGAGAKRSRAAQAGSAWPSGQSISSSVPLVEVACARPSSKIAARKAVTATAAPAKRQKRTICVDAPW